MQTFLVILDNTVGNLPLILFASGKQLPAAVQP